MQRSDLWYMVVFRGTAKTPSRAAGARAAASTTQEASNPNRQINGKRRGCKGSCWKVGRGNWGNPSLSVRGMCWRKEETHLWVSPLPSHTRLKAVWKWQVSGDEHSKVFYIKQAWKTYVVLLSLNLLLILAACRPHIDTLFVPYIHPQLQPTLWESGAMYQTPITTHSLPATQRHTFTHAHTDAHCLFISRLQTAYFCGPSRIYSIEIKAFKRRTEKWTQDCWCQPCKVSRAHARAH